MNDANPILSRAESHAEEILHDIVDLVNLETHSYDLLSLRLGLEHVRSLATKLLGEPEAEEVFSSESTGDMLHLVYAGDTDRSIALIGHYDTVWPSGTLAAWGDKESLDDGGRTILSGPGIFDMKAGLVQALWSLKIAREEGKPLPTVHFLLNGDEETGSSFSRAHLEELAQKCDAALVFEASQDGKLKTSRKGVGLVSASATGIESHAGLDPDRGASAINALMEWSLAASKLANPAQGTTVNVGLISGGTGSNVVAGFAQATLDIRIAEQSELDRIDRALDEITWSDSRVKVSVDKDWNRPPMEFTPASQRLWDLVTECANSLGRALEHTAVGGASDANFISALGIPVVCGIGAVGDGAHARNEHIVTEEVPFFTALAAQILIDLSRLEKDE